MATEAQRQWATEDTEATKSEIPGRTASAVGPPEADGPPEGGPHYHYTASGDGPRQGDGRPEAEGPPEGGPYGGRAGQGRLRVSRAGRRSVVTRAYATSPLRLLTPANHGAAAWIYTSSYGGGFVDGDRVDLEVEIESGAAAFLSTQSATKIYRSPSGTQATLRARVDDHALFVSAPDPVVCFAGARHRQRQHFSIAPSAGLVVVDAIVSGRYAAGERWAFLEYHSLIDVTVGGRLAAYDPIALRAADGDLPARLGRFDVLATVIIAGGMLRNESAHVLETCSREPVARRADQIIAASPLGHDGCIVRVGATSTEQAARTLRALLHFLPSRLDDDPWRRKW